MSEQTMTIVVESENESTLVEKATQLVSQLGDVKIETQEDAEKASAFIKFCRETAKAADAERMSLTRPIDDIKKDIKARVDGAVVVPLKEAMAKVQSLLDEWMAEQERIRQEQIKREREEQEAKALAEAAAAQEAGNDVAADRALQKGTQKTVSERKDHVVRSDFGASASGRVVWHGQVVDFRAFLQAILNGDLDDTMITINQSAVDGLARSRKAEGIEHGIQITKAIKAVVR